MSYSMKVEIERFPIAGVFRIARGARTEAQVVTCTISCGDAVGHGECVPYPRYDETVDSVIAQIEKARTLIEGGLSRKELLEAMPAGAARNAVDCALWDVEAKISGKRVYEHVCDTPLRPVTTAATISLGTVDEMAEAARGQAMRPLLKVKVGAENDAARIHAVAASAPNSRLIIDANEGWTEDNIRENLLACAEHKVALVEQPLPAGGDAILAQIPHPVPVCADESLHTAEDLPDLKGRYDAVNIKLDKTGGLTAAITLHREARAQGFSIMIGCMVGSSLAMAPAMLLAQDADFVDLDGPLLLKQDREPGLKYTGSVVSPPLPELWG
ncbi:N-acetyl-D-Glu racemase DgcA [Nitratireductor basaltis]|uniref:Dipeptide epimerase n=1 Tax=Nitratireductor basaltis TaxID=472175 RepID=A0A084UAV6_9HYPH|nr:N-acetyl-D-Glu racemase DgcA [Nitratireductor basaltis]KFB10092.1 Mandelate racemase/muconate lactonizing-like protein [Nitratireductor basaltis]